MHIAELQIENFRIFGSGSDALTVSLLPGLNVFIGENDCGKTAIVDAIRLCLGTTSRDQPRLAIDDFHLGPAGRSLDLTIRCKFAFNAPAEAGAFVEYLTPEPKGPALYVMLRAIRPDDEAKSLRRNGITVEVTTGPHGSGPRMDAVLRQQLTTTFLKALRDAASELSSGRGSRLSQILASYNQFVGQEVSDFDPATGAPAKTLVGIMRGAEHAIENNPVITQTQRSLNDDYLRHFTIANAPLEGHVGMAPAELRHILEKLDLWIESPALAERTIRGLGSLNILFMASELLLLRQNADVGLPLLLIEEPEAHLHPQLQLLVSEYLAEHVAAAEESPMQVIMTTHSPTLGSKLRLDNITLMSRGRAFPLAIGQTLLEKNDYRYLERFMDATKANLFFARGVLIVEGDAENILLPTLARLLDRSLTRYGVSIVKVGSTGLFRYSRIFRRAKIDGIEPEVSIRVACVADRDIADHTPAADVVEKRRAALQEHDGGSVRTFVSPYRTLESDLVLSGLGEQVHRAVSLARAVKSRRRALSDTERTTIDADAKSEFATIANANSDQYDLADAIYAPLKEGKAGKPETAQFLAEILEQEVSDGTLTLESLREKLPAYLIGAIEHVTPAATHPVQYEEPPSVEARP
ncbi:MAG: ATP-dependent nuclease [Burkholderiales bacterium]